MSEVAEVVERTASPREARAVGRAGMSLLRRIVGQPVRERTIASTFSPAREYGKRTHHTGCKSCGYLGNRHLCACVTEIGAALGRGECGKAQALYTAMVERARREEGM